MFSRETRFRGKPKISTEAIAMLITIKFLLPRTTFGIEARPFLARAILATESDNDLRY